MSERGGAGRQAGLAMFAFVATFVLLAGGWALLGRAATGGPTSPRPSVVGTANPPLGSGAATASPSGVPGSPPGPAGSGGVDATVVLTGAGDIGDCALPGARQTSDLLVAQPGWFFTAGDHAYPDGSNANFDDCYAPTWGRVRDRTILPAAGDLDWTTEGAAGYHGFFGPSAAPDGTTWYSMDVGAWHVIVLDSDCDQVGGCGRDSPQGAWLARDLTASTAHCTLAIWHHPRFSSGEQGDDPSVASFWDQLHAADAELVINGHDRDYERFAPQDPSGIVERPGGLREIVVGTGGAELGIFKTKAANSEFRLSGAWGVLRITLHPVNYDWEFLPVDDVIADAGSTPCH
jgi:acid phosphatase type 7